MVKRTQPIVIDCHGHVLGRVAAIVAKNLLLGKRFVLVRCEDMQVCGTLKMRLGLFVACRPPCGGGHGQHH